MLRLVKPVQLWAAAMWVYQTNNKNERARVLRTDRRLRCPVVPAAPVPVAGLVFLRPAWLLLAVVASEPTLGATAYVGGGGAGVRSRSPRGGRGG